MEEKQQEEAKGRIKFRLEYDFTLQELKVTVSNDVIDPIGCVTIGDHGHIDFQCHHQ